MFEITVMNVVVSALVGAFSYNIGYRNGFFAGKKPIHLD